MAVQPVEDGEVSPTWARLEDQLDWYDRKSVAAQRAYKRVKLSQLIIGAAVPVFAGLQLSAALTATLAAYVVVAEGAQQLYQWQTHWVLYRATADPSSTRSTCTLPLPAPITQTTGSVFSPNVSKAWFRRSMPNGRNRGKKTATLLQLSQSTANRGRHCHQLCHYACTANCARYRRSVQHIDRKRRHDLARTTFRRCRSSSSLISPRA